MNNYEQKRAIGSMNKALYQEPRIIESVNAEIKLAEAVIKKNVQLRKRLTLSIVALQSTHTDNALQDIIKELEDIKQEYKNLDQFFIVGAKALANALLNFSHPLIKQIAQDSVPQKALDARHTPARKARQLLWKEWDENPHKYTYNNRPSKAECARRNYTKIMTETGADKKVKETTFIRWLNEKRPAT